MIGLGGQPLELLGKLEQFRFDVSTDHKTDERPDLTPLLAIVACPEFRFRHYQPRRCISPSRTRRNKASNSGNLVTGLAGSKAGGPRVTGPARLVARSGERGEGRDRIVEAAIGEAIAAAGRENIGKQFEAPTLCSG